MIHHHNYVCDDVLNQSDTIFKDQQRIEPPKPHKQPPSPYNDRINESSMFDKDINSSQVEENFHSSFSNLPAEKRSKQSDNKFKPVLLSTVRENLQGESNYSSSRYSQGKSNQSNANIKNNNNNSGN